MDGVIKGRGNQKETITVQILTDVTQKVCFVSGLLY
mgnify:CR=1 FL=1